MFKKILITADLGHLEDAEKAVKTALEMTQNNPDTVYRVMSVVPPFGSSFVSSFLPKNFDQDVLSEANKALHAFTKNIFLKGRRSNIFWRTVLFMRKLFGLRKRKILI